MVVREIVDIMIIFFNVFEVFEIDCGVLIYIVLE